MSLSIRPPLPPMLARLARELPEGRWTYEPKWDGFRVLAFRNSDDVDLRSRNDRRLARYFPEVVAGLRTLEADPLVLDGEIVVLGPTGLDFAALLARLHPAASRAARLAEETPAVFIAFDVLAAGDADLRARPFRTRRARLETLLARPRSSHVMLTPATTARNVALGWLERFHGHGVDGVVAKDPDGIYEPGRRTMVKVKKERTAECVVAGFRVFAGHRVVASVLLGLYDGDRLVHVGVASQFTETQRRELFATFRPRIVGLKGHPWEHGFGLERSPVGRLHGAAGRWSPDEMEPDWIPVRPELVCEVAYGTVDGRRLRYPARFRRWRPDRDPRSCRVEQLDADATDVRGLVAS